jgi:hypothetical protein
VSDFITILPQARPLDPDDVCRLARHACLDIHGVDWVRAYLAAGKIELPPGIGHFNGRFERLAGGARRTDKCESA